MKTLFNVATGLCKAYADLFFNGFLAISFENAKICYILKNVTIWNCELSCKKVCMESFIDIILIIHYIILSVCSEVCGFWCE